MKKRAFKDIELPLLGFGCMRLPKTSDNPEDIDYKTAEQMVDLAISRGVNYFDTAWGYHNGCSEPFVGHVLKKHKRESFYLATKMPTWNIVDSLATADNIFTEQQKRLQTNYFDFYLAHNLNADSYKNFENLNLYSLLKKKKEEGKVKHLGFSFHGHPSLLQDIVDKYEWDFAQIQLNYIDWETIDAKAQYDIISKNGIPIIVMEPLRGGSLASLNPEAIEILAQENPNASASSWALRFAASKENIITVLSGMSAISHVEDNIKTFSDFSPLSEREYEVLKEAEKSYNATRSIPCTACNYCMKCPFGVNIPRVFSIYNLYKSNGNKIAFNNNYRTLSTPEKASSCYKCGKCIKKCPQDIDIPTYMEEINEFLSAP